jgi:transcriptional regulator with XRE-family HTH domain
VRLGDVLKKERALRGISVEEAATKLRVSAEDYRQLENGQSPIEKWGPLLARMAVNLGASTSQLISETGRAAAARQGACGALIRRQREGKHIAPEEMAFVLGLSEAEYAEIERGESEVEYCGPLLLRFAELIEQPIFNLFYPCGVPLDKLTDYP